MAFPTSPDDGDEYTNALGTIYKYLASDDKWYIIAAVQHNDLSGLNDGDVYEHITQTQKDDLHAIYTLEVHDNDEHDPNYLANISEDASPQLGADLDLNEHNILMDIALDSDGEYQAVVLRTETVDENTFGFGGLLHMQPDGHFDDANNSALADMPCSAIAVETGTGSKKVMYIGFIRDDTWDFTVGDPVIVGDNGTAISIAALDVGDYTQIVGIAKSADSMFFNPSLDYVKRKV